MGLLGCPTSFQCLMEAVAKGINNVLVYIDNLLVHSSTHEQQLKILDQLLRRLIHHGIKVNLEKCVFGNKNVAYLGFRLTDKGNPTRHRQTQGHSGRTPTQGPTRSPPVLGSVQFLPKSCQELRFGHGTPDKADLQR